MRRDTPLRGSRGLTLIEMVITLTILALAGAIIYGALGTALRSWNAGFAHGRDELVARIVLERLGEQLKSAIPSTVKRRNLDAVAFDAGEDHVRFVTILPVGAPLPVQVSYSLDDVEGTKCLVYREYPWPDKAFFGDHTPRREERLREIEGFAVAVSRRPDVEDEESGIPRSGQWRPTDLTLPGEVEAAVTLAGEGDAQERTYTLKLALPQVAIQ